MEAQKVVQPDLNKESPETGPFFSFPETPEFVKVLLDYFGVESLGEVGWSHRKNTLETLCPAIENPRVHLIEGDIRLVESTPVMSHGSPQPDEKHFPFKEWLRLILPPNGFIRKGIKSDFKEPEAVEPTLMLLQNLLPEMELDNPPLIFNADVLQGPGGPPSKFQPEAFINLCRHFFPETIISLGFTTVPGSSLYSEAMIKQIRDLALSSLPTTVALRVELVNGWAADSFIKAGIPLSLWSDQDVPLGDKWWQKNIPWIRSYKELAFMDFPDYPHTQFVTNDV